MKFETKYLRISELFENAVKNCLKNLALYGMSWNIFKHNVQLDNQGTKTTLSPSFCCSHLFVRLAFLSVGILLGKCLWGSCSTFLSVVWWPFYWNAWNCRLFQADP